MKIFGFEIEFNKSVLRNRLEDCITRRDKGYVCIVDGPSLVRSYKNLEFMQVLHGAYLNSCDGGSIAQMSRRLYGEKLEAYTGPEIFADYIERPEYRQLILGSREEMFDRVSAQIRANGHTTNHLHYLPLPFATIDEFDYAAIAKQIAAINPDIIWVSLGAPKQEFFMQRLLPYLSHGLMLGIGAALGFYTGDFKDYSFRLGEFRFNWIYRLIVEPRKQWPRVWTVLTCYPIIYWREKKIALTSK